MNAEVERLHENNVINILYKKQFEDINEGDNEIGKEEKR